MTLEPLALGDMEQIRIWRHEVPETLRTPYMLTQEMQEDYYRNTICNRNSTTRYWALVYRKDTPMGILRVLCGYGGIENISWENRTGEISVLISPEKRGQGLGKEAVRLFLDQAFNRMNLEYVYGECYMCGPWEFWKKQVEEYLGDSNILPARKYWNGEYYQSYYFTFSRRDFNECNMHHPC